MLRLLVCLGAVAAFAVAAPAAAPEEDLPVLELEDAHE